MPNVRIMQLRKTIRFMCISSNTYLMRNEMSNQLAKKSLNIQLNNDFHITLTLLISKKIISFHWKKHFKETSKSSLFLMFSRVKTDHDTTNEYYHHTSKA